VHKKNRAFIECTQSIHRMHRDELSAPVSWAAQDAIRHFTEALRGAPGAPHVHDTLSTKCTWHPFNKACIYKRLEDVHMDAATGLACRGSQTGFQI